MNRLKVILIVIAAVGLGYLLIPRPPLFEGIGSSRAVYDREGELLRLTLSGDGSFRHWTSLASVSPVFVEATLLYEDRYFYWHPGVNPLSLVRAAWRTYVLRTRRVGGSTITMQVARMRYWLNSRTIGGKLYQIWKAIQLERHYSKEEILEAYLNMASYGGNIEGVGAASLIYFRKDPSRLTVHEALTLCIIPKSPARRRPDSETDLDNEELVSARKKFLDRWLEVHPEDREKASMLELPMTTYAPGDLPFAAPHFVDSLLAGNPGKKRIMSTLDSDLQAMLERTARGYIERKRAGGLSNASAMIVDFRNMEVKALLGSANFFDDEIQGQVNGTRAKRSPGSTLKPFIYALGMEQNLIHPMTMLKDAPASFGAYNPENFDSDFEGPMTVKEALIKSRNLPAVQVARMLDEPDLYGFLEMADITELRDRDFYGLALVLGGAEMTMEELVRLYAMLANGGSLRPLRTLKDDPVDDGIRLLSEETAFLTLEMLAENPRPGQGFRSDWTGGNDPVYWKTGTSYGFRDAWSIAVYGPYVIAVWVGNFSGEGNPAFVGRSAAAPLLFEIIDAVKAMTGGVDIPYRPGQDKISRVKVCAVSGNLPGPHCKHTVSTWFIPGKSPIKTCDIHREIIVNTETGLRACEDSPHSRKEIYEFWPSDILKIFKVAGVPRRVPPPYSPECRMDVKASRGIPPEITSPVKGLVYTVRASSSGEERIALTAVTDADAEELYWFVDENFIGKTEGKEPFFWTPVPGNFVVRVVDDNGRSDARRLKVVVVN